MQNRTLEPTGLATPGKTRWLIGIGPGLVHQDSAGRVSGWSWNRTDPFVRAKPGPLAGLPYPLLILDIDSMSKMQNWKTFYTSIAKVVFHELYFKVSSNCHTGCEWSSNIVERLMKWGTKFEPYLIEWLRAIHSFPFVYKGAYVGAWQCKL